MGKVVFGLLAAVFATIVAANLAYNAAANTGSEPINEAWAQDRMEFVAWNDERWTAWIRDEAFEQTPQNTSNWSRHSNASLAFIDWSGETWQAKIDGEEFLLAARGDWSGSVQRATAIRYRDWQGRNQVRTVAQLRR
jgi:hypothetical protein